MKQKKFFTSIAAGLSIIFVILILSMLLASIERFALDLIPSIIVVSTGVVILLILFWKKFGNYENMTNMDERYGD